MSLHLHWTAFQNSSPQPRDYNCIRLRMYGHPVSMSCNFHFLGVSAHVDEYLGLLEQDHCPRRLRASDDG